MRLPYRILVLQDDPAALTELVQVLRDANYLVTGAATSDAARRLLALGSYDLLISDVPLRPAALRPTVPSDGSPPEMAVMVTPGSGRAPVSDFLREVSCQLSAVRRRRRWDRQPVMNGFRVLANGHPASIVDACYGGLRLDVPDVETLPAAFDVEIEEIGLHLPVELVWMSRSEDGAVLLCGLALSSGATPAARTWRAIVDRLA